MVAYSLIYIMLDILIRKSQLKIIYISIEDIEDRKNKIIEMVKGQINQQFLI